MAALETRLFINGEYVDAKSKERLTCYNPVDNSVVNDAVHVAGPEDIAAAVKAASDAFPGWAATPASEKSRLLHKLADIMLENADELTRLESLCSGKPLHMFKAWEFKMAVDVVRYYAGWCDKIQGDSFPAENGFIKIVRRQPIGVCAAINAFNGPLMLVAFKAAPALAAGNTMIMKASEKTPLSTLFMGKLLNEAGFPPGVLNFVSGGGSTGALLASDMEIRKISFTGSAATGKRIAEAAAKSNLKRVTLELGGKSPSIIFPDANLEVAVKWCVQGITVNSGQACIASSRVYVHKDIKEPFVAAMKAAFESLGDKFGDPKASTTMFPPLADSKQFERVSQFVESGKSEATLVTGGSPQPGTVCGMRPTIFVDPKQDARIYKEEIFGPVVVISDFIDEDEVIARANDTSYGLSGAVFTQDINRAMRISSKIQSGTVCINCCTMIDYTAPFGGFKESGWGRELGKYGIEAYTEVQTCFINMTY